VRRPRACGPPDADARTQDVTSYVIARTLGATERDPEPVLESVPESESESEPAPSSDRLRVPDAPASSFGFGPAFFGSHEALAGAGVFSPAASAPGSPVLERRASLSALAALAGGELAPAGSVRRRANVSGGLGLYSEEEEEEGIVRRGRGTTA
jgi:hypothetical protein